MSECQTSTGPDIEAATATPTSIGWLSMLSELASKSTVMKGNFKTLSFL